MITQERLKELVTYNPETGDFHWIPVQHKRPRRRLDLIAGGIGAHGYWLIQLTGSRKLWRAHRLAWLYVYGELPVLDIDHINNIRHDNRIENLREVSSSVNHENLKVATSKSKSGILGVSLCANTGKWRADICVKGKRINLGLHGSAEEARQAYLEAKRRLHAGCTI